jgi:hypothetical protein
LFWFFAAQGNVAALRWLLDEAGIGEEEVDADGAYVAAAVAITPLVIALICKQEKVVEVATFLLARGADPGRVFPFCKATCPRVCAALDRMQVSMICLGRSDGLF